MLSLTESAKNRIMEILVEEGNTDLKVRVFVQGGGCSGFQYGFTLEDTINDDDFEVDGLLVDSMSMQYLVGATINFKDDLDGQQFVIDNPNAETTCGCGSSFSV